MKSTVVCAVTVLLCCASSVSAFRHHDQVAAPAKVSVSLYLESMCPDCMAMLAQILYPAYANEGLDKIMDLTLVPYGNAHETEDKPGHWVFDCQHGDEECQGNLIETCALKLYPALSTHFPFFNCLDTSNDGPVAAAPACAKQSGMDWNRINACAQGADGNKYEHEMAVLTEQLKPAHKWVPWVTVNGKHNDDADSNPISAICAAYTGDKTLINACMKVPVALYYESYCPGCKELITTNLFPAIVNGGLNRIMDLTLVPYGNTKQIITNGTTPDTRYNYTCQHGDEECAADVYEQCALLNEDPARAFNFIYCLENSTDPLSAGQSCAQSSHLIWSNIQECAEFDSWEAQETFANMTNALKPEHDWVPWVTINGDHPGDSPMGDCDSDAVTCICKMYKGVAKVPACNSQSPAAAAALSAVKSFLKTSTARAAAPHFTMKFGAPAHKKKLRDNHRRHH